MSYYSSAPEVLRGFLTYHENIKGHSSRTVDEYFLDLRTFFRFLKQERGLVPKGTEFDDIDIMDVNVAFVGSVTLAEVYAYLNFLSRDRVKSHNARYPEYGLNANSRARKIATIRSYYKYLTTKAHLLEENPVKELETPKLLKSLPRYLSLEESMQLLNSVDGANRERDLCILTLFLNCGLRISEVVGLNLSDISADHLRVVGKGNKERVVFLNDASAKAINDYLEIRRNTACVDRAALFVSRNHRRISTATVHSLVKKHLSAAGIDPDKYSAHKLRHTAATLMLHNGVDVRTLQELLGHEHLNTTQIYTHVDNDQLRIAATANPLAGFSPRPPQQTDEQETD